MAADRHAGGRHGRGRDGLGRREGHRLSPAPDGRQAPSPRPPGGRGLVVNEAVLDDRQQTRSARNVTEPPWNNRAVRAAATGRCLGSQPAAEYAAPAGAEDLWGLPPACIARAEFDPNRDEDIDDALRLLQADGSVELHQWPGTFHGSPAIQSAEVSQRRLAERGAALRRGGLARRGRRGRRSPTPGAWGCRGCGTSPARPAPVGRSARRPRCHGPAWNAS
ncbi:alpha/beta hydrolase fold domain-containing protein [Streptomyces flaveolus]|uniref:alpha/beta hydrolase n=1 Tax=Streptomyces flaveolus TaxID=67297 RepID=UPI003424DCE7